MEETAYMEEALNLARMGLGYTSPNPTVGCVIVKDGEIVGRGYHHQAGTPHAEVWALREAKEKAKGPLSMLPLNRVLITVRRLPVPGLLLRPAWPK